MRIGGQVDERESGAEVPGGASLDHLPRLHGGDHGVLGVDAPAGQLGSTGDGVVLRRRLSVREVLQGVCSFAEGKLGTKPNLPFDQQFRGADVLVVGEKSLTGRAMRFASHPEGTQVDRRRPHRGPSCDLVASVVAPPGLFGGPEEERVGC